MQNDSVCADREWFVAGCLAHHFVGGKNDEKPDNPNLAK
jgi:hypothetical protein